jgi:glycerol-3-phosphate dehydrogenase
LSAKDALAVEPALDLPGLSGAAVYQDLHLADPHGLVLAMLNDAAAHGAVIANHVSIEGRASVNDSQAVAAVDVLSGERLAVRADAVINATGPWAQHVADRLVPGQKAVQLTGSKGIHLVTPQLASGHAIAVSGRGEHVFCIPWHGYSLFGTTDDVYGGDPGSVVPTPGEVDALRAKALRLLPSASAVLDRIVGIFAGVRALPGAGSDASHAADGAPSVWTVTGGKWTTARLMAEKAVDLAVAQSGKKFDRCSTTNARIAARPMAQSLEGRLAQAAETEMAVTAADFKRRLGRPALIADPGLPAAIDSWLARRAREEDSAPGRSGRL